jgi:hypothetical protein
VENDQQGGALEPLHTIPTHLATVDTVLSLGTFALSSRQVLWLLVGGSLGATLWIRTGWLGSWLPPLGMLLHGLLLLGLLICILALTFGQVQGRSLESWLIVVVAYLGRPRLSLWRSLRRQPAWPRLSLTLTLTLRQARIEAGGRLRGNGEGEGEAEKAKERSA